MQWEKQQQQRQHNFVDKSKFRIFICFNNKSISNFLFILSGKSNVTDLFFSCLFRCCCCSIWGNESNGKTHENAFIKWYIYIGILCQATRKKSINYIILWSKVREPETERGKSSKNVKQYLQIIKVNAFREYKWNESILKHRSVENSMKRNIRTTITTTAMKVWKQKKRHDLYHWRKSFSDFTTNLSFWPRGCKIYYYLIWLTFIATTWTAVGQRHTTEICYVRALVEIVAFIVALVCTVRQSLVFLSMAKA